MRTPCHEERDCVNKIPATTLKQGEEDELTPPLIIYPGNLRRRKQERISGQHRVLLKHEFPCPKVPTYPGVTRQRRKSHRRHEHEEKGDGLRSPGGANIEEIAFRSGHLSTRAFICPLMIGAIGGLSPPVL
jgi:hypothetical protein